MDGMRLGGADREAWPQAVHPLSPLHSAPLHPAPLHPAFLALAPAGAIATAGASATQYSGKPAPGIDPDRLAVAHEPASLPEEQMVLRFGLELAWLRAVPALAPDAALLLAGRAAGGFYRCLDAAARAAASTAALVQVFDDLAGALPSAAQLAGHLGRLRATGIAEETGIAGDWRGEAWPGPSDQALAQAKLLWNLAQACEMLLVSGGDDRLHLDAQTGLNRYGCPPWPVPGQVAFASSTASSISEAGQKAAETLRRTLITEALTEGDPACIVDRHTEAVAAAILRHFGVPDLATAVLTASGTDAALVLTRLLQAEHPGQATTSILMSPAETGSGVPEAVCARHFAPKAASGDAVRKGAALDEAEPCPALATVRLRTEDGTPRTQASIAADCADAIAAATARGRAVLHAIDGSKSGLAAPDRDSCVALASRFGERLDIVIDACQARIEPALVRFYLERGFPVLVTGSKFFGAPGFCGAILYPSARLARIVRDGGPLAAMAPALDAYASLGSHALQRRCPGLLLRWAAALQDMQAFGRLPAAEIRFAIERFAHAVRARIMAAPRLSLHAAPRPAGFGWSGRRSVFTFAMYGPCGPLSASRLRPLYQALAAGEAGTPCLIGQPVDVGAGALRVALSAAQIVSGEDQQHRLDAVFDGLQTLLARDI